MDLPQTIIIVLISIASLVLIIVGVELFFFLKKVNRSLTKIDRIIDDAELLSHNLTRSSLSLAHLVESMKSGLELAGLATRLLTSFTSKKTKNTT
jgi:L-asparagine transporter-like permease